MSSFFTHLIRAFFVGILVFIILTSIQIWTGSVFVLNKNVLLNFLYTEAYSIILYLINYYTVKFLIDRFGKHLFKLKNIVLGIVLNVLATAIGIFFLRLFTEVFVGGQSLVQFLSSENPITYWLSLTIAITITSIFYIVYYNQQKQEIAVKTERIIAGTASAKFDALKNQLDPHFLFNSLNVLSSLIEENPRNAQKFTTSLSKVYRYVLEQKNKELVSVDEELDFARTYSNLLKMRFEDSVIFDIPETSTNPNAKVVPLSLQLLLENAVKHNVVSVKAPLRISIYEEAGFLVIKNNLQAKEHLNKRQGVGLSNIKSRYALLTERAMKIIKTPNTFEARLPILTKQLSMTTQLLEENTISQTDNQARLKAAKEQVKKQREFYGNLVSYCFVIPFLAFINYTTMGWGFMWFLFPMFGWGLGLMFHAMDAFDWNPFLGSNWQEKKIKELMNKDNFKNY